MIKMPIVTGMVATNYNSNITALNSDGKEVVIGKLAPRACADLDFSILGKFLSSAVDRGSIVVVGENTYEEMCHAKVFHRNHVSPIDTIVSTPTGAYVAGVSCEKIEYTTSSPKDELCVFAFNIALKRGAKSIAVLGGKSVYEAFAGHYAEFYHCMFKFNDDTGKQIKINEMGSNGMRDPDSLIDPSIKPFVYIDNQLYTVRHYKAM